MSGAGETSLIDQGRRPSRSLPLIDIRREDRGRPCFQVYRHGRENLGFE